MQIWLTAPLFGGEVQGVRHAVELFAAFGLTTLIGLERTIQGKNGVVAVLPADDETD